MKTPVEQRKELGSFLRARRERLQPEDVGLLGGGRRRTPGLRREEVASLAGVGVTWYTWLEQARDIKVSPAVLDAICRALQLDANERAHAYLLNGAVDAEPNQTACAGLGDGFAEVLDQLDPFPAAVFTWRYDIIGYNTAYRFMAADLDAVAPSERNLLWLHFTHPDWREHSDNRAAVSMSLVSKFRAALAGHLQDPLGHELIGRLQAASPEFVEQWESHDVTQHEWPTKVFNSPAGQLHVTPHKLSLQPRGGSGWVTIYSPADALTRARMEQLGRTRRAGSTARDLAQTAD